MNFDFKKFSEVIGKRESNNLYNAVNTLGYIGKYQFGAAALEDMGLVKTGTYKKGNKALLEKENWTIEGGREAFLLNHQLQEDTFKKFTERNYKTLIRLKVIDDNSSPQEIAGYLATSHLQGPGGALALKKGENLQDAYGTKSSEYYDLGYNSQK